MAGAEPRRQWTPQPFNTVQLLLSVQPARAGDIVRQWYEKGWAALGGELRDWFSPATPPPAGPHMPHGVHLELYRPDMGTGVAIVADTEEGNGAWHQFLSGIDGASGGVLAAGEVVRDRYGGTYRGNADQVVRGLDITHQRYDDSDVVLWVGARWEFLLTPARQAGTLEFFRGIADAADPSYGEIAHAGTSLDYSAYEYALGQLGMGDIRQVLRIARHYLRGYGWVTIVPRELARRLGAPDRLAGTFAEVHELASGALWLRATDRFVDYDHPTARRVHDALASILRPGTPVPALAIQSKI